MASGTIYLQQSKASGSYIVGKIEWTSTANNSANTSDVTCNLYVRKGDTDKLLNIPTEGTWSYSMSVNKSIESGSVKKSVLLDWVLINTMTINGIIHNNDGSKSIPISASVTAPSATAYAGHVTSGSGTATFDKIPRASSISSVGNVTLGNSCNVQWTPASANFRYKLKFSIGSWSYTTGAIHPNRTTLYTYNGYAIPLTAANQIPNSNTGTMSVTLYTYSDTGATAQVGVSNPETFTVTVPNNSDTKPTVSMALSPVSSLPSKFSSLYIQGKTKVKATLSATGKYGATINSYSVKVDNITYGEIDSYTSGYLSTYGSKTVTGYVTDSRSIPGEKTQQIEVIAYQDPKLESASAVRCNASGNASSTGTHLKIVANIGFTNVNGLNKCKVQYCYAKSGGADSDWDTLGESTNGTITVNTSPLLGTLSAQVSYVVKIRAVDEIGNPAETSIVVLTENVYMHKDGAKNALGLGKYNERTNALDSAWDLYMNGKKVTGLPTPTGTTDAVPLSFLKDYIVEQGTSEKWTYRKWSSGLVELWGICTATLANGSILSGHLSYPFALTGTVYGIGTLNDAGGNDAGALPWNLKLTYGLDFCEVWVHNPGNVGFTSENTVNASVYIVGRWT